MITSYIISTYIFSPSLLLTSCLCNIQWRWASNCSVSCCNSFSWMLPVSCVKWSFNSVFSTSFKSSLFFLLRARIESFLLSSALARHGSLAGVPFFCFVFFVSFPNSHFFSLFLVSLSLARLATGFDLSPSEKMHRRKKVVHPPPRPRRLGWHKIVLHWRCPLQIFENTIFLKYTGYYKNNCFHSHYHLRSGVNFINGKRGRLKCQIIAFKCQK